MSFHPKWFFWTAISCCALPVCPAQDTPQDWSESQIIERFLALGPQARELRARVALTQAEARTRTVYSNPSLSWSREGAGYNEFFEATQTLPWNGRIRYLREAGTASVSVAEANREALLWSLRSDLRIAFYRMVASQERLRLLATGTNEVENLIRVLRRREDEGEGSRYDRIRAEREAAELRIDTAVARSLVAAAGARLAAWLPEGSRVQQVRGDLTVSADRPDVDELVRRAMGARADYRAEQKNLTRYQIEEMAARRLRIAEPQVSAGVKRADVTSGVGPNPFSNVTHTGLAISLSVPLPLFNNGRYEVARYQAEQEQSSAHIAVIARQIRTEIQGARDVLAIRAEALAAWQHELASAGADLTRITQTAYEEGEIGILELLDSVRVSRTANLRSLDLQTGVKEAFIELERVVGEEIHP
jgi:cobalt-zinc-cadmium efflux system outer membrane protein